MRRSVNIELNLLTFDNDIDLRNELVDEIITKQSWAIDGAYATDIDYEVISCDKNGNAVLKAEFEYLEDEDDDL